MRSAGVNGRLGAILVKSGGNELCFGQCRLHFRRVTAVFRFKRGHIQASGAENGSGLRISMRSAWICGGLLHFFAKSGEIWPGNANIFSGTAECAARGG